jgi:hypothetical protein
MRIPPEGGNAQEILSGDYLNAIDCSTRAGGAFVLTEVRGNACTISLIDAIKGRGPKVLETTGVIHAALSPNGKHIAFLLPPNRIRITDLHGATEEDITVSSATYLTSLEWSADGAGFFSGDAQPAADRLLYIERRGVSHVLWNQSTAGFLLWGSPSHDGRYLATFKMEMSANVWMVEIP